ncbi:SDR family NAD(P)-dependent oxidoreductase [Micrococcus luteus]|uniref:SDR family NAD(P)-dependent oxidoreductase n=1 Tax=Micrococcus luteus TaxID=1270 RepID=UPI00080E8CA9|nr:SDR family NAD(P)-dependent oxidoreductase [Micrococcus luteus]
MYVLDVRERAACVEVVGAVAAELGGLDVLASNAGIYPRARIVDMTGEDIDLIFDVNVKGTIHAVQAAQIGFVRPAAVELARQGITARGGAPSRTPTSCRSARDRSNGG